MLQLFELVVLLCLSSSLICDDAAYDQYLISYPFKAGADPEKYKELVTNLVYYD